MKKKKHEALQVKKYRVKAIKRPKESFGRIREIYQTITPLEETRLLLEDRRPRRGKLSSIP